MLTPDGSFVVTVNLTRTTPRTVALVRAAIEETGLRPDPDTPNDRVNAGNVVSLLRRSFAVVEDYRHDNALVFPDPAPLIGFAVSLLRAA